MPTGLLEGFVCHSGGADGADTAWEVVGREWGVPTNAYSFEGHRHSSSNPIVLSDDELDEGFEQVKIANQSLQRNIAGLPKYVRMLIGRDWFQIKNAESVFAVGQFGDKRKTTVDGGTGWGVQMAIDNKKPVYFFDQESTSWYEYNFDVGTFEEYPGVPLIKTKNFAGIGTRDLTDAGATAILEVYEITFNLGA